MIIYMMHERSVTLSKFPTRTDSIFIVNLTSIILEDLVGTKFILW